MTVGVTETTNLVEVMGDSFEITITEQPDIVVLISEETPNEIVVQELAPHEVRITVTETSVSVSEPQTTITIQEGGGTGASGPLSNYTATVNPTANDDSGDGYEVGSIWVNVSTGEPFILVDATIGAAIWQSMLGGGGSPDFLTLAARDSVNTDLVYGGRPLTGGAPTSSAVWQIYRLDPATEVQLFADGDQNYDNIWDNRESLTYS